MEIKNCGIAANIPQLLRLLGPAMYKGNTVQVAIKELLQNSFDAVKGQCDPEIEFRTNQDEYYLECRDNGIGMSPETVTKVYLTIGGTLKDNLAVGDRSGGLGLAKVQFFLSATRMRVDTVHNGVHTHFDCSQEELMTGNVTAHVEHVTLSNGTTIRLYYPKEVQALDGSVSRVVLPHCTWQLPDICDKPLLGYPEIKVKFNGNTICNPLQHVETMTIDLPWAEVVAAYQPSSFKIGSSRQTEVYSAGLYQFSHKFRQSGSAPGHPTWMNIRPKVTAGTAGYPFNNTREGFNVCVEQDLKVIAQYLFDINAILTSLELSRQFDSLKSLSYITVDGKAQEQVQAAVKSTRVSQQLLEEMVKAFTRVSTSYQNFALSRQKSGTISQSEAPFASLKGS